MIAANIALKVAKKHGLFKLASKLYKLFLTAAPAVVKNERSFSSVTEDCKKLFTQ
jgi:hypothetical protein